MKNQKHFLLLIGVLILILATVTNFSVANANPKNYLETMVENFPTPNDNEFSSPEMVVNSYIDAIRNNEMDQLFKCLPMLEYYKANTMVNFLKRIKAYIAACPIPGYDLKDYMQLMQYCMQPVHRIILLGLYADTGNFDDVINSNPIPPILIDLDKKTGIKEFNEVKKMIDMNKLKKVIGPVTILKLLKMDINDFDEAMGVTEKQLVVSKIQIGASYELFVDFTVGYIGHNWKVISVVFE